MSIWITALGVGGIGFVYGYLLFYSYKRHHTPLSAESISIQQALSVLIAIGAGGVLGGVYIKLEGVNYLGPYGIGLMFGMACNVVLTKQAESD